MRKLRSNRALLPFALVGVLFVSGTSVVTAVTAQASVDPTAWTTSIGSMSRDSYGNPMQISFTISGLATDYAICLKLTSYPSYNTKGSMYSSRSYTDPTTGKSYAPCNKFTISGGGSPPSTTTTTTTTTTSTTTSTTTTTTLPATGSDTQTFGDRFTFGGPATYEVDWYVPDVPGNGGIKVGTAKTFKWANSGGTYSPCPPDPQLQIGVWRPSRHQVLNRCKTLTGTVRKSVSYDSLDKDHGFPIGSNSYHTEYMLRDTSLKLPSSGSSWTITGVFVCDRYHGWKEFHPVFLAKSSSGANYLTGPEYSTATPTVTGTWSLKSCG
jgi:hypothetical protein